MPTQRRVPAPAAQSVAKKLDRRLAALGAAPLLERGLGDDQVRRGGGGAPRTGRGVTPPPRVVAPLAVPGMRARAAIRGARVCPWPTAARPRPAPRAQQPGGYDAALDPWLAQLWPALRAALPLPPGAAPPALAPGARLQLGPPKFRVTLLPLEAGHRNGLAAANGGANGGGGALGKQQQEEAWMEEAVAAAAAFRAVSLEASGLAPEEAGGGGGGHGPWRPFMAPLLVNERLTASDHFQDTRHLEFDLGASGLAYEPGDSLAVFPRTPEADVQARAAQLRAAPARGMQAWHRAVCQCVHRA